MEAFKPGDVCIYSFAEQNKSCALVEIVRILNDERGVAEVKFLEVMVDDTGNGYFNYLLRTGGTMNASFKYLRKEDSTMNENGKHCAEPDYKAMYEALLNKTKVFFSNFFCILLVFLIIRFKKTLHLIFFYFLNSNLAVKRIQLFLFIINLNMLSYKNSDYVSNKNNKC